MNLDRNQYNEDERLYATIYDSTGMITGSTSVLLTIIRDYDNYIYDFGDGTFKVSGWTTSSQPMTELDSTSAPGVYYYDWDVANIGTQASQRNYFIEATHATATNSPQQGYLKLGGWIDNVNALGGVIQGSGGFTDKQAKYVAEEVWKVILQGKKTAKEILLSRSDFDATKDYVMCENEEMKEMMESMHGKHSEKLDEALESLIPIDYNAVFEKVLDKVENVGLFIKEAKNDIISDNRIEESLKEIKKTSELLKKDLLNQQSITKDLGKLSENLDVQKLLDKLESQSEENAKNIRKVLLKMTELKFDSDNMAIGDFEHIKSQLEIILDFLEGKI